MAVVSVTIDTVLTDPGRPVADVSICDETVA